MKNILSYVNRPVYGREIREWVQYHVLNETEYSRIARRMTCYLNCLDDRLYVVETTAEGTGCGERRRGFPVVRRFEEVAS